MLWRYFVDLTATLSLPGTFLEIHSAYALEFFTAFTNSEYCSLYHSGTTVDYVGATINLNEGYQADKTTCRWVYDKLDGTHVDYTWFIETERADNWIDNENNYQMWVNPGQIITYYYDMENDGVVDITVIFNALGATKS